MAPAIITRGERRIELVEEGKEIIDANHEDRPIQITSDEGGAWVKFKDVQDDFYEGRPLGLHYNKDDIPLRLCGDRYLVFTEAAQEEK